MEVTLANETLLTGEEAVMTAAAAQAVALARAALEAAKEAVQLSETTDFFTKPAPQTVGSESLLSITEKSFQNTYDGSMNQIEEQLASSVDNVEVTVRSRRQEDRRARRQISDGHNKTKGKSYGENNSRDLLKIVKKKSGAYKPLTMAEERDLSEGVQVRKFVAVDLLHLSIMHYSPRTRQRESD
jgi:hypothetical protein